MQRVLEPEVMDDVRETQCYDAMDHSEVNLLFVADLCEVYRRNGQEFAQQVIDLGTGTARIPIELCKRHEHCQILAADASIQMLEQARLNIGYESLNERILPMQVDANALEFGDQSADLVMSNSLVHHLHDPSPAIGEITRITKSGGHIFVRDLCRPASSAEVEQLVSTYAAGEAAESQQLLRQSFYAALTLPEIRQLVENAGMNPDDISMTSDRHWTWSAQKP